MNKKIISIQSIINLLEGTIIEVVGPVDGIYIDNIADVENTVETTLDWINPVKKNKQQIAETSLAKVILVDNNVVYSDIMKRSEKTLIVVDNPKMAFSLVGNAFFVQKEKPGIHPTAIIDPEAQLGKDVYVGPYVHIGNAKIGDGCRISSFVRIYDNVLIGKNCYFKEGAVIGGPGFGFERDESGNRFRFPQIGKVVIGDHVEVGANSCIDRGALSDTILEDYVKIDNLCQIAHNVHLGKNVVITGCSAVSGSCVLGDDVWVGPNSIIRDQRKIGKNAFIGMGSVVMRNVPEGEVWSGNPAKSIQ
jgi:UDP-3-O-[3-hydroxymyristoyl] glucosamine N-acyltransferase